MQKGTERKTTERNVDVGRKITRIVIVIVLLAGLSLILYPTVSDYWNRVHQSGAIMEYANAVKALDNETFRKMWDEAVAYNEALFISSTGAEISTEDLPAYEDILNVTNNGMMAYIDIPKIKVHLPILHGTDEGVLQSSVGHYSTSSFPVGGENTHCVLTGHRGLPSARLFTDLDQLVIGDRFQVETLGIVLTYEIDQIVTVLPYEIDELAIKPGKDYCTLITCTPYGVNSHRLLIRGVRVEDQETQEVEVQEETQEEIVFPLLTIEPMYLMITAAIMILYLVLIFSVWPRKSKKTKKKE